MERQFMTSAQVAEMLGVGPTSVKRWADSGLLPCVRTPGGHRRFLREEVERFLQREANGWSLDTSDVNAWVDRLTSGASAFEVQSALFAERNRRGSWWQVADTLSRVMAEMGRRWERGNVAILDEHAATESLVRAIARCSESIPVSPSAPTCLLAAAMGEDHTLGLTLGELVLRGAGWQGRWAGRVTPTEEVIALMDSRTVDLVAVAALESAVDPGSLQLQARRLVEAARRTGVRVVLAGIGPWPELGPDANGLAWRVRSFEDFDKLLATLRINGRSVLQR
jgi:excisionase family DNA binding protein